MALLQALLAKQMRVSKNEQKMRVEVGFIFPLHCLLASADSQTTKKAAGTNRARDSQEEIQLRHPSKQIFEKDRFLVTLIMNL